jgi:hypothetical protein
MIAATDPTACTQAGAFALSHGRWTSKLKGMITSGERKKVLATPAHVNLITTTFRDIFRTRLRKLRTMNKL